MRILVASFQVWYGTVLSPATRWTRVVTCSRRLPKPLPIYGDLSLSHFTGSSTEENKISFSPWLFFSVSQNLLQLWHCLWASDSIWTWRYFCPFNCHLWRARKHCQRMTSTKRSSGSRRRCRIALIELQKDTVLYLTVWKSKGQFAAIKQAKRVANETVQAGSSILIGSSLLRVCFRISRISKLFPWRVDSSVICALEFHRSEFQALSETIGTVLALQLCPGCECDFWLRPLSVGYWVGLNSECLKYRCR